METYGHIQVLHHSIVHKSYMIFCHGQIKSIHHNSGKKHLNQQKMNCYLQQWEEHDSEMALEQQKTTTKRIHRKFNAGIKS